VSRVVLYRHFDTKTELYRAVLDRARTRLADAVGTDDFTDEAIPTLVHAGAAADPDAFRLLFRFAAHEPEFRAYVDTLAGTASETARRNLAGLVPEGPWADWAGRLVPIVAVEAVIAWLDTGQPDPDHATERIGQAIRGVIQAARQPGVH
jgi:AcrR family transcriptional regulator